ncbi:hypothetical protein HZ994_11690 [Akkermansiaceae bacterium]|nr:hypothetical protein HZ994_11690 [Akkermansiaceae bacterium]
MIRTTCLHTLACMLLAVSGLSAQAILAPPFGLRWGDSPEKLISWSSKHSLDLNIFLPGDQPGLRVLSVRRKKGFLPDSAASAVEGKFLNGGLYEVTVHYSDPEAGAEAMEGRFEKLRKQLTTEQGPLVANQQRKLVEDQFVTRTQSFHREPVRGVFLLIAWTEVEDLLRKSKEARFSLIYRNDNFRDELAKRAERAEKD